MSKSCNLLIPAYSLMVLRGSTELSLRDIQCRRLCDRRRQFGCRARALPDAVAPLSQFGAPVMG
jgi:hypothetical protein